MSKKIITVLLIIVAVFEVFFLPDFLAKLNIFEKTATVTPAKQTTTEEPYKELEVLSSKDYPKEVKFPKNYMLVFEHPLEEYETIVIENGNEYLVLDTSYSGDSGLYIKKVGDSYFYRKYYAASDRWLNWSAVDKDRGRSYMETELTKQRWPYPSQFVTDVTYTFEPSGKELYVDKAEKVAGVKCNHYVTRSAWYEYEYWVDPKTNITLKYQKANIRFDEYEVVDSFTARIFSTKKIDFSEYISDDDREYEEL